MVARREAFEKEGSPSTSSRPLGPREAPHRLILPRRSAISRKKGKGISKEGAAGIFLVDHSLLRSFLYIHGGIHPGGGESAVEEGEKYRLGVLTTDADRSSCAKGGVGGGKEIFFSNRIRHNSAGVRRVGF